MGLCARGPDVILSPEGIWLCDVSSGKGGRILDEIAALLADTGGKS